MKILRLTLSVKTFIRFGLFPFRSPLLRESLRFIFLWLLRCFTSPGVLCIPMYSVYNIPRRKTSGMGFPIRKSRIKACLGAPRGLSHPATSFFVFLVSRHPPCALVEIAHNENTQWCFRCFTPPNFLEPGRGCVDYYLHTLLS